MPRKYFIVLILSVVMVLPHITYAQTPTPQVTNSMPTEAKNFRIGPTLKQAFENKLKSEKSRQETIKNFLEQKKQKHEEGKEALMLKLENFKDLRKKNIVLKLDERIASISSKKTERMSDALGKLEDILMRIKNNADTISGCDKTSLNLAISTAESALASAFATVNTQATKIYTFNISAEDSAKTNVGATVKLLTQDLRTTHQEVMNAKQAVVKAAVELRKIKSCVKQTGSPTSSPSAEPTIPIASPSFTLSPTL